MNTRPLLWAALAVAFAGCASTIDGTRADAAPADVPPGVNPDGGDPFRPVDAGPIVVDGSTDTGVVPLPDASVFDERYGYLYVGAYLRNNVEEAYASAEFRLIPRPEDPACRYVSASNWDVITCDDERDPPADPHPRPFPNPGTIALRGPSTMLAQLTPLTSGDYRYFYDAQPVFRGPVRLRAIARGTATVPAFDLGFDIPGPITVTAPSLGDDTPVTVSTSRDLTLAWRPTSARSVYVQLSARGLLDGVARSVRVLAEFPGVVNTGTLPRRTLTSLARLVNATDATLTVVPQNLTTERVGAWPVQITAVGRGVSSPVVFTD